MFPRREFLTLAAGAVGASFIPSFVGSAASQDAAFRAEAMAHWRKRINALLARSRLPIIDVQATYIADRTNVGRMIEFMNHLDVAQIVFAAAHAPDSSPSLELYRKHPEYFIPCTNSGEFPRWFREDQVAFVEGLRKDIATGRYFMMGEHEFRHYPSPEQYQAGRMERDITIPIDGPGGHALFKLASDTGVAFQIHYEIEDVLMPALESMLAQYPKAKVIWCHLGLVRYPDRARNYGPDYVRGLIARFPGLRFDLAVSPPNFVYRPSGARDATVLSSGSLNEEWRAVIEAHPDRFLAAGDYRPPVEDRYDRSIKRQRELILDRLSERARHLVAYANAWRLITGEEWKA